MAKIKVELHDDDVSLLKAFARDVVGQPSVSDLVAVIVTHSKEMKALRTADETEHRLISGLIGGGYL